tara:strand:+ start:192 stop:395 length:204 start_codon:yes stop_codon:yes gene_type:complete
MSKHRCTKVQHVPQENWFISSNEGTNLDLRKYKLHSAKGKGDYFYISSAVAVQQEMQGRQQENIPDI